MNGMLYIFPWVPAFNVSAKKIVFRQWVSGTRKL